MTDNCPSKPRDRAVTCARWTGRGRIGGARRSRWEWPRSRSDTPTASGRTTPSDSVTTDHPVVWKTIATVARRIVGNTVNEGRWKSASRFCAVTGTVFQWFSSVTFRGYRFQWWLRWLSGGCAVDFTGPTVSPIIRLRTFNAPNADHWRSRSDLFAVARSAVPSSPTIGRGKRHGAATLKTLRLWCGVFGGNSCRGESLCVYGGKNTLLQFYK